MEVNMIIALNSQPIQLKNNLTNFAALSQKVRGNIIHYFSRCFNSGSVVTFSLRQLLKRTRENRIVSVNSHFNLRQRQKENYRVTLLSNQTGYLRPRFQKSLDLQPSCLVGQFKKISAFPVCFIEIIHDKWGLIKALVKLKMA